MSAKVEHQDRKLLESFRPRYEQSGFDFYIEPSGDKLPSFLSDYHPDAIAIRKSASEGGVVVEVKRFKQSRERSKAFSRLAAEVARNPNWKLDVVYSTPFHPLGGWLLPSDNEVREELGRFRAELEHLEQGQESIGDERVLLLLLWPLFEAAARRRLTEEDIELGEGLLNSKSVLEKLVLEGIISDEEGRLATDLLQHKDFASAGFREPTVDAVQLRQLMDLTNRLLSSNRSQAA